MTHPPYPRCARMSLAVFIAMVMTMAGAPPSAAVELADLEVTPAPAAVWPQPDVLKLIHYLVTNSHYQPRPLDDEFSALTLQAYLDALDPSRIFFLSSDIQQFDKLKYDFDDYITQGNLKPAFAIFNIFRTRVDQRTEYALARVAQPFDFTVHESYLFKRDETPWASDVDALNDIWRQRLKNDILNMRLAGQGADQDKDNDEIIHALQRRYLHMSRSTRQSEATDVFQRFVNSYINAIDPHTNYNSPRHNKNFEIQMRLSLDGIGAQLQTDNEYTLVQRIIPGGPADRGRELKAQDRILGVAQGNAEMVDVIGWRLGDVVNLIRGPKASIVRLEVVSKAEPGAKRRVISIQRDKIDLAEQAATKRLVQVEAQPGRAAAAIGVIRLPSFYIDDKGRSEKLPNYRSTTRDVRKLIEEFRSDNIDGLIIDLRSNGGGGLEEAISLSGLFIDQGPVVQVRDAGGKVIIRRDPDSSILYDGLLVVMVDRYSASASEIFAGVIQDYRRGIIIGETTFGKGTVQHIENLSRYAKNAQDPANSKLGHLKITIAQFFRINGDSTQHRGIVPDIAWPSAHDVHDYGDRVDENAIPWRRIQPAAFDYFQDEINPTALAQARLAHQKRIQASPEFRNYLDIEKINAANRDKKSVTLNAQARAQEQAQHDQQRFELENRLRRAMGQELADSVEDIDRQNEEKRQQNETNPLAQKPDVFLREGANILADYRLATRYMETSRASFSAINTYKIEGDAAAPATQ